MNNFYQNFPELPDILTTILNPPKYLDDGNNMLQMHLVLDKNADNSLLIYRASELHLILEDPFGNNQQFLCKQQLLSFIWNTYQKNNDLSIWIVDNETLGYEFNFKSSRRNYLPEWRAFLGLLSPKEYHPNNRKKRNLDSIY